MDTVAGAGGLTPHAYRKRLALLAVVGLVLLIALIAESPREQDKSYHNFADQRLMLGVPNALNVLSNIPFMVVGLVGLVYVLFWCSPAAFAAPWERWAYVLLFTFVLLTGFGSAYYHLEPDNNTLYWDRLPMAVVFMTFFTLILADRVSPRVSPWLCLPLVAAGVFATTYWHWTELQGAGDLRLYVLVQFVPLLLLPVVLVAFPARHYRTADLLGILGLYVLAKLLELLDGSIYTANGVVSGHTLKHLVAALGAFWIVLMLRRRYTATQAVAN
jgi:hypothetical protein